ncbi:MAG: alpha-ketoacid dehydrogenase subunit beta [Armatimonadetes bacterium]|nr:alpha-ketoacid dehydrogenase subunit beta [Armatimonadota bacterium]
MPEITLLQALSQGLWAEMERDERVVLLGEDIGHAGGVFVLTKGFQEHFGEDRVIDTPLSEGGIIGTSIGLALNGLRPVPEIQFVDFIYPAFDLIVNEMAKMRYRTGGQYSVPMVVRSPYGGGIRGGHYHSQSPEAYFAHTAGLKVVIPSNPYDAKGLLISSIRDPDPVIFLEPKKIYRAVRGEVPEEPYMVPLGEAKVTREGEDLTLIGYGTMLHVCMEAAEAVEKEGVSCEVIDLRTIMPFDLDTILGSVRKTGRLVIVHEAPKTCGFGAEIAAQVSERALLSLEAPIIRVTGFDTPFPYSLEDVYLPDAASVVRAIHQSMNF